MVISSDTNVLVRFTVRDNAEQAEAADHIFEKASVIVISLIVICEFAWVLKSTYKFAAAEIATAIQIFLDRPNALMDRQAVEAGLSALSQGGDFADGVIAFEGTKLGGTTFVSFDRKAVAILKAQGYDAQLLG